MREPLLCNSRNFDVIALADQPSYMAACEGRPRKYNIVCLFWVLKDFKERDIQAL